MRLAWQLVLAFVLLAALAASVVAVLSYQTTSAAIESEAGQRLRGLTDNKAVRVESWCVDVRRNLSAIASLTEVGAMFADPESAHARKVLRTYAARFGYRDLILISPRSVALLTASNSLPPGTRLDRAPLRDGELFRVATRARMFAESEVSDFVSGSLDQEPTAYLATPVFRDGLYLGVLACQIDNNAISEIVNDETGLGQTGETLLAATRSDRVRLLTPTRFDPQAAQVGALPLDRSTFRGLGQALAQPTGLGPAVDHRGHPVLAAWRYLPSLHARVVTKLDQDEAYAALALLRIQALLVVLGAVLLSALVALAIARSIVRPVSRLTGAVRRMAGGDLKQTLEVGGAIELQALSQGFNTMASDLNALYASIEEKVEQRTRELRRQTELVELLKRIATAVNQAPSLPEAVRMVLGELATFSDWPIGHAYVWDGQELVPSGIWYCKTPSAYARFQEVTGRTTFTPGTGLPGRVYAARQPIAIEDVSRDDNFPRFREPGVEVRGAFGMPVFSGTRVVGVLEFYAPEPRAPDLALLTALAEVGYLLGRVFEREESQRELSLARDAAERANEAKSAFLATMSHEIRTPMNAVIGMTHLLLETHLNAEQQDFARTVLGSAESLLAILNEILDFSKIEAGKLELESEPFDLTAMVESAMDLMAGTAAARGIELVYQVDRSCPRVLVGDSMRLRQVLVNLMSNALKFTEKGEVQVLVEARPLQGALHEVQFSVRDTGIGIPAERMDRLFQAFTQVDASTTRRYGGTGLGLAICQRYAEAMGGRIWAESQVGVGTTFFVTVRGEARSAPMPRHDEHNQPMLRDKKVLVVDDNATNRRLARVRLESWGMRCYDTEFPSKALEWIMRGDEFDVAVLDMQMPESDGIMLATAIRALPNGMDLPLIAWTSLGRKEADFEQAGFTAHLHKPLRPSLLYNVLVGLFGGGEVRVLPTAAESAYDPELASRHPLRILVADDVATNLKMMILMLERFGYSCETAVNGVEVLAVLGRTPIDLIFMDINMPEMDGVEATRQICANWPADRRPRIVALTANVLESDRALFREAGMEDFLSKPFAVGELKSVLLRCPAGRRAASLPARPRLTSEPGLDTEILQSLRAMKASGSPEVFRELLAVVEGEFPGLLAQLGAADEAPRLQKAAHAIRGAASSIGANRLARLMEGVEREARDGSLKRLDPERLAEVRAQVAQVIGELQLEAKA